MLLQGQQGQSTGRGRGCQPLVEARGSFRDLRQRELAVAPRDLRYTFTDIAADTPLANLFACAFQNATKANIGLNANGAMRAGLTGGTSNVQTVYDVFAVAPPGAGVVDPTAGSAFVTGWLTPASISRAPPA
jgi:2',3'-cyclic-nucleotide 2'-phosphodiesterase (5'-nucleotidase family)